MIYSTSIYQTQKLDVLKASFLPYEVLWSTWEQYKGNGLSADDLYVINVLRSRHFEMDIDDFIMFYYKADLLGGIANKLQMYLPSYKLWLIKQWQYCLCGLALNQNFDVFFSTSISHLELHTDLKNILKEFNCNALKELMKSYPDEVLATEPYFDKIQRFLIAHAIQSKPHSVRKEVGRKKNRSAQII